MNIEQERELFHTFLGFAPARMKDGGYADPDVCEDWRIWQARAALQSQDREKHLVAAIREAIELLGPEAPLCSGCEYEWNHALRVLREAIDHARSVEGGGE